MQLHQKQPVEESIPFFDFAATFIASVQDWADRQMRNKELSPGAGWWSRTKKDACGAERGLINNWHKRHEKTAVKELHEFREKGNDL